MYKDLYGLSAVVSVEGLTETQTRNEIITYDGY